MVIISAATINTAVKQLARTAQGAKNRAAGAAHRGKTPGRHHRAGRNPDNDGQHSQGSHYTEGSLRTGPRQAGKGLCEP